MNILFLGDFLSGFILGYLISKIPNLIVINWIILNMNSVGTFVGGKKDC